MLWLIVPAYNEEKRLGGTLQQYRSALSAEDRVVIVVNGSTDGTEDLARAAAGEDGRLIVIVRDTAGKGRALLAGFQFVSAHAAAGDVVCYTDADAAVGGDEIVRFCSAVSSGELRVGSRWHDATSQLHRQPVARQIASRVFNHCVRSALRLDVKDTQCAAKAVRAESLAEIIRRLDSNGFAFDVDLILAARAAGLAIAEVPVLWTDKDGSTVSMRRAAPAMIKEILRLRRKYRPLPALAAAGLQLNGNSAMRGHASLGTNGNSTGPAPAPSGSNAIPTSATTGGDASSGHPVQPHLVSQASAAADPRAAGRLGPPLEITALHAHDPVLSERTAPTDRARVLSWRQKVAFISLGVVAIAGLLTARIATLVVLCAAFTMFFAAANLVKIDLIRRGTRRRGDHSGDFDEPRWVPDHQLPVYTILLPVYREDALLRQLIAGIEELDYPKEKLDVKLLLEEHDVTTREAADELVLPPYFDVVVVPDGKPTGKPRACNAGLARAKGEYLVIYDAEDRPDRDQLRKAVNAFAAAPPTVVCMQGKLNYFNRTHNLLTRWFTAEYSLWFDQLLPGLQAMDVAIPLGGTSNHFVTTRLRQLGGWDSFNVTEDADLGIRIYVNGWKTAILDSTTYEEATSRCHNWIRQRSRWVKGYMQTYLRHMRHPLAVYRAMGPKAFVMLQLFFGAGTLCLLANPFYWLLTAVWFADHYHLVQVLFPRLLLYLGIVGLFFGNAAFTLAAISGAYGRRNYEDVKWALLTPLYWLLMSVAAWKAFIQLCYKPFYWEKTVHGYCMYGGEESNVAVGAADVPA